MWTDSKRFENDVWQFGPGQKPLLLWGYGPNNADDRKAGCIPDALMSKQLFVFCFVWRSKQTLTWEKVGLDGGPSSSFSLSTLVEVLEGTDIMLEENILCVVLPTDGRVLWDRSQLPDEDSLTDGAVFGENEIDAGVAITAAGVGGWVVGGLGARCLVDLAGAGGWGSAASGSLELTEISCREMIIPAVDTLSLSFKWHTRLFVVEEEQMLL